jgi:2-polyprenyl-3-methyl-5-hydroxy-6-metoxy-1,4-benzoquinol methylase
LTSNLRFPLPPGCSEPPVWTANGFLIAGHPVSVLSYDDIGPVAWNEELTEVHEEVAADDHYIERGSREHAADQLRRWLGQTTASIMDIGCSSGSLLQLLRSKFPNYSIVGADCVRTPLERLSRRMQSIPLLHFDLLKCPWPEDSFDAVVLLNVLSI